MTDQKRFEATDDDLPTNLWDGVPNPTRLPDIRNHADLEKMVEVQVRYPAPKTQRQIDTERRRYEKAIRSSNRDALREGRRTLIRYAKKHQMFQWLLALEPQIHTMDTREKDFCYSLLAKFRKYGPQRAKWITKEQYDWLLRIAMKCL